MVGKGENRGEGRRVPRVEREMREVIATYLLGGFRGQLDGIVSVTRVIASRDLRHAKVFVSAMGEGVNKKAIVNELQAHAFDFQSEINRRLRMKYCPRLTFLYDEGFEKVLKVDRILRDLGEERNRKENGGHAPPPNPTPSTDSQD